MYDLLFVTGNLIKRIKKRGKESENERRRGRERERERERKEERKRKRLKVQIGLFISFLVHKRDGIYSQCRISFDQRLCNYDRSTASLPHFAKWKRSIACLYEPIFQEQSVIQRLVKAMSIKQHLRVSGYFSIYSYDFFLKLPFDSTPRYYSASFNTRGKIFQKKKNRNSAHSIKMEVSLL